MSEMKSVTLQQELHDQIRRDLESRIADHQQAIAAQRALAPAVRPLNLIAAGDSWFDYPLSADVGDQLKRMLAPRSLVLRLAHAGDATTEMMGVTKRARLVENLRDPANGTFDGILFSGGGNDLVGEQFRLWLNDAPAGSKDVSRALNHTAFTHILGVVETAYLDLIAARDLVDHRIPIFIHTYDFAIPSGVGVCHLGPWLLPSLEARGWMSGTGTADLSTGSAIVKLLLTEFDNKIAALAASAQNNVVHVKAQGTLSAADWANELHPTPLGFQKIASKFLGALQAHLPDRPIVGADTAALLDHT